MLGALELAVAEYVRLYIEPYLTLMVLSPAHNTVEDLYKYADSCGLVREFPMLRWGWRGDGTFIEPNWHARVAPYVLVSDLLQLVILLIFSTTF